MKLAHLTKPIPLDVQTPELRPGVVRLIGSQEAFEKARKAADIDRINRELRGNRQQRRKAERELAKYGLRVYARGEELPEEVLAGLRERPPYDTLD